MPRYALFSLTIAIAAAILGFGVTAGTFAMMAKVFSVIFMILFVAYYVGGRRTLDL